MWGRYKIKNYFLKAYEMEKEALRIIPILIASKRALAQDLIDCVPYQEDPEASRRDTIAGIKLNEHTLAEQIALFQKEQGIITPKLRDLLINQQGYLLDIHPEATYISGHFEGQPLTYLGSVEANKVVDLESGTHRFLVTTSSTQRQIFSPYQTLFQLSQTPVYTRDDTTWIDFQEDNCPTELIRSEHRQDFEELKRMGLENYQNLAKPENFQKN